MNVDVTIQRLISIQYVTFRINNEKYEKKSLHPEGHWQDKFDVNYSESRVEMNGLIISSTTSALQK